MKIFSKIKSWLARKLIKNIANKLLAKIEYFPEKISTVELWIARLKKIISWLELLVMKADDQQLDDKELDEIKTELSKIIDDFKEGK